MVQTDKLLCARIVEDQIEEKNGRRTSKGTKVREDILSHDRDTLFPLQGALGYEITQTLFVGKNTLLVEGPSDILYLQALSSALGKAPPNFSPPGVDTMPVRRHSEYTLFRCAVWR